MKKLIVYILTLLFIFAFGLLFAQEEIKENVYISFLSGNVDVDQTPDNEMEDFEIAELDMELGFGTLIRTGQDALCEITMPDGSTIKISSGSVFQIESIDINRDTGKKSQRFKLVFGKIRAKVEKLTTRDSKFEIVSGTALAGVRGTTYGVDYDGIKSRFLVFDGSINLSSVTDAFESITINKGQMGVLPKDGIPEPVISIPDDVIQEWNTELEKFGVEVAEKAEEVVEEVKEEEVKEKGKSALGEFLNLNAFVGTVTIGDQVFSRWVFTPEVHFGKLSAGLYLPAIFSPDVGIFGFKDWQNHDEWDFQDFGDGFHDFIIKFYYVQWAEYGDPLYVKVGSIDDFFLGHGFIVDNYSNMISFPDEITVGMQLNLDAGRGGVESMIADFSRFQILGARMFFRPLGDTFPFIFGVTGFYDRPKPDEASWPTSPIPLDNAYTTDKRQLPQIFILGADVEFPIVNIDMFTLRLYADIAKLGYIYPEVPQNLTAYINPGVDFGKELKGLGTGTGVMGRIMEIVNYRVEYRYIINYYEPGMIDYLWENRRLEYYKELHNIIYEQNQPGFENTAASGFLLKGGVILFKKLEVGAGYESYQRIKGTEKEPVKKGQLYAEVFEGLIPKVHGSFSYNRTDNLDKVFDEPFDENTVLDANVIYQLSRLIGLSVAYNRTFQYDDETDSYEPIDSFGITTIFTFF